jgi:hypothetical protein
MGEDAAYAATQKLEIFNSIQILTSYLIQQCNEITITRTSVISAESLVSRRRRQVIIHINAIPVVFQQQEALQKIALMLLVANILHVDSP